MKGRRLDNQRLTRPRALPSWRGVERRQEDQLPIIDFEGYLDMGYTPKAVDTPVERSEEPSVEVSCLLCGMRSQSL